MQTGKRAWWHRPCAGRAFQLNAPKQEGPAFLGLLWSQLSARPGLCCKADVYLWQGGQPGLRGKPTTPLEPLRRFPRRSRKSSLCLNLTCAISETPRAATAGSRLTGPSSSCPQIEILSPYEAVAERFKEQYKMFAMALDTTRHELPLRSIHLDGDGQQFLGRKWGVCQATRRSHQRQKFLCARHLYPFLSPSQASS